MLWLPGARADLRRADLLDFSDLSSTNLSHADLSYATLTHPIFSHTNLFWANLDHANIDYCCSIADMFKAVWVLDVRLCHTTMPDGSIDNRDCPSRNVRRKGGAASPSSG